MGFVGFLKFAFKCFDLLAWPLFGLGCPLYASIRAIENNSNSEMRNLVAYWILFSLVSLFELAFAKLIQWLPFWSYMKLMAMCLLVLPDFNGAGYVYECLLRLCLSVDLRVVMKYFIRPKEDKSLNDENFLSMAERYVQEHGSEALEKLLDRKSKHTKPDIGVEEIKAMTNTGEKETAAAIQSKHTKPDIGMEEMKAMTNTEEKETPVAIQSKYEEPIVGKVDARAVEPPQKTPVAATKLSQVKEPSVGKENSNMGQLKDKNPAVATEQVKRVEPNLAQNEKKTVDAGEIKEKTVGAAGGENKAVETTGLEIVQREWTCALCQVRTTCEKDLHSHLQGRRHMDKCQELKASLQMSKTKGYSSSAASPEPKKILNVDRPYDNRTKNQQYKVQVNRTNDQCREKQADLFFYREPEESKEQQEEEASVQEYDYGAAALGGGEQWNQLADAQWPVEAPAMAGAVATGWTQDAVPVAGDEWESVASDGWESAAGDGWGAAGDSWELAVPAAGDGWGAVPAAGDGWGAAGDGWEPAAAPRWGAAGDGWKRGRWGAAGDGWKRGRWGAAGDGWKRGRWGAAGDGWEPAAAPRWGAAGDGWKRGRWGAAGDGWE